MKKRRVFILILLALTMLTGCGGSTQRVTIAGESMVPALTSGEKVNVDKKAYASAEPARGDIIAFRDDAGNMNIKRVVGLPGETVEIKDGKVYVAGDDLKESYLNEPDSTEARMESQWTVAAESVFVLGDNRKSSRDSRDFGCVEYQSIIGKVGK